MVKTMSRVLLPVIFFIVSLLVTQWVCEYFMIKSYIFPSPLEVIKTLITDREDLWRALKSTTFSTLVGLSLSLFVGLSVSLVLSISKILKKTLLPYFIFFQTVPLIALAPLLVIWFGFGTPTVVASSFLVSLFPVINNSLLGLQSTDRNLEDLFSIYRASVWKRYKLLKIPFALPYIFSGLRIASGLAVVGAIVGEFIAGGGLGGLVDVARTQQRVDKVFAAVLISSLLGLLLVALINFLSWATLKRWHASEQEV